MRRLAPISALLAVLALFVASAPSGVARAFGPAVDPDPAAAEPTDGDPTGDAEPGDADPSGADDSSPSADPAEAAPHPLEIRAQRVEALIEGALDLDVDPATLFVVDLADPELVGPGGDRLRELLLRLDQPPPPPKRHRRPPPPPESPTDPATALANAWTAYLRLSEAQRAEVLAVHARRQQAAIDAQQSEARRQRRLETVTVRADHLAAFLAGALDLEVEPRDLLTLDLADERESGLVSPRRQQWAAPPTNADGEPPTEPDGPAPTEDTTTEERPAEASTQPASTEDDGVAEPEAPTIELAAPPPPTGAALDRALTAAEQRLDRLRLQFLALSTDRQAALFERHEQRRREARQQQLDAQEQAETEAAAEAAREAEEQAKLDDDAVAEISSAEAEAEAAAADREQALAAARLARTEVNRILANERARLFSIKEAQARYDADLNRRKADRVDNHALVIEWSRRVEALEGSTLFGEQLAAEADPLYRSIRTDLSETRDRLRTTLSWVRGAGQDVPRVGDGLDRELDDEIDRGEIVELRTELLRKEAELVELEREVAWELAQGLRDDVVLLNAARLTLLELTSASLRAEVTGFGPSGVDQARRELDQISLELSFHVLKLPHYGDELLDKVSATPIDVAVGFIKIMLIGVVFGWWRRRAPETIRGFRRRLVTEIPLPPRAARALAALWYFSKVRRPLELLLALWLAFATVGGLEAMPELALAWIVVRWLLIGQASILLLDALASRNALASHGPRSKETDTSALRFHSLRVVGLTIVAVGMLLALAAATVGKGAIYRWVLSTCWVLSVPVLLYLVQRWRPTIKRRLGSLTEQSAIARWGRAQAEGRLGFISATFGAAYLLARGVGQWFLNQLSDFEITRRILAYLFRREVARTAKSTSDERFDRVDTECYSAFDPDVADLAPIDDVVDAELTTVAGLAGLGRPTFSAVVGERGLGKSTFVQLLRERLGHERIDVVCCPEHGVGELFAQIAATTDDESLRGEPLAEALRLRGPRTLAIDDAQRLITPSVRGLRPLDELIAFARLVGGEISWVITMDAAAWHYLQRARGDRVFFEHVVNLPRWTETQLGTLIRRRCEAVEIAPSFEGLVVPRAEALESPEEGRSETGYYRLLWDFSRGNPAVAQHAFRESLFVAGPRTVVRLFEEPAPSEIEDLSPPLLFVLRAIVQLDLAVEHELVAATLLPAPDVSDAVRFCLSRGYIEPWDAGMRVTWRWYRTITAVLARQHLLSTA